MTLIIWLLFGVGAPVMLLTYIYYVRGKSNTSFGSDDYDDAANISASGLFSGWTNRPGIKADLIWIIALTVVSFTFYSIFVRQNYTSYDLSYFVWPLVVALQTAIAARIAKIFIPRPWNRYGFHLLNGVAAAYFIYSLLGKGDDINATFIHYFYGGSAVRAREMTTVLSKIAANRQYFALAIGAITVYLSVPHLHEVSSRLRKWRELVLAVSFGLVGAGVYAIFASFSSEWGPMLGVGWVFFAGFMAMALGTLAYYGRTIQDAFISEICLWLSLARLRMFIIGAVIAGYLVFLRPFIYNRVSWVTALIEWITFCFVVWRMYDGIRGRISDTYSIDLKYTSWKKHMQLVQKQVDGDYSYASKVQSDFIERSHKDQLLVYLVTLMHDNGMSVEEISEVLHPLSQYNDVPMPAFAFTKKRNVIRKSNWQNRDHILKEIMEALAERDITAA